MDPGRAWDRENVWVVAWSANWEKMGNLYLQKGDLPKLLHIVFYT